MTNRITESPDYIGPDAYISCLKLFLRDISRNDWQNPYEKEAASILTLETASFLIKKT